MNDAFRQLEKISSDMSRSLSMYNDLAAQLQKSTSPFRALQNSLNKQLVLDRSLFGATVSALSQARLVAFTTSNFRDLSLANQRLTELVSNASISNSRLSQVFAKHNVLRESLKSVAMQSTITALLSSLDTTRLLHTSLSSQFRLLYLESRSFGQLIEILSRVVYEKSLSLS